MINSMTGYGSGEYLLDDIRMIVDIKTVNNRYLDVRFKLPSALYDYEIDLKKLVQKRLSRGKVDVFIKYEDTSESSVVLSINRPLLTNYQRIINNLEKEFNIENDIKASHFLNVSGVVISSENQSRKGLLRKTCEHALGLALDNLIVSREVEGKSLKSDLMSKLNVIEEKTKQIEEKSSDSLNRHTEKLFETIQSVADRFNLKEDRVYTEAAILADKHCIDEETVRMLSHVNHFKKTMEDDGSVGKKLDFISQEMNREVNTILSKSVDLDITNIGLDIKSEVEKIREQVQNVE